MATKSKCKYLSIIGVLALILHLSVVASFAKEQSVHLLHHPLKDSQVGEPGLPMGLTLFVRNSRDTELNLRLLATIDGKLMDLPPAKGYLNNEDVATYEFSLFSPRAGINYQFILITKDGEVVSSKRFELKRPCRPDLSTELIAVEAEEGAAEQIKTYKHNAVVIDQEIKRLDEANRLLSDVQRLIEG